MLDQGADAIKLYAATWRPPFVSMPPETVRAVTAAAHERGRPVFAHPTNAVGLHAAIENGVDVLVHTTPTMAGEPGRSGWTEAELALMREKKIALIPTLKLFR